MTDCTSCDYPMAMDEVIIHFKREALTEFIDLWNRNKVRNANGAIVTLSIVNDGKYALHHAEMVSNSNLGTDAGMNTMPPHWYFIYIRYCPLCGCYNESRTRRFDARPDSWELRHEELEMWDGCNAL